MEAQLRSLHGRSGRSRNQICCKVSYAVFAHRFDLLWTRNRVGSRRCPRECCNAVDYTNSHETSCQEGTRMCSRRGHHLNSDRAYTAWSAPIATVQKISGAVSICGDLTHLEKSVRREQLVLPLVMSCLEAANVYSKLDPISGLYQVSFSDSCRELTRFVKLFGHHCYKRHRFRIA